MYAYKLMNKENCQCNLSMTPKAEGEVEEGGGGGERGYTLTSRSQQEVKTSWYRANKLLTQTHYPDIKW